MYDFILQTVLVGSLAVMAFLAARALPRVEPEENPQPLYEKLGEWFGRLPLHHLDERANTFLFKFLKRARVIVLKLDNRITRRLEKVRDAGERRAPSVHVQELIDHVQKPEENPAGGSDTPLF